MNELHFFDSIHVKLVEGEIRSGFDDRLAEYESLGLTPDEIKQQLDEYRAYRHACGGYSPEAVGLAVRTRDGYNKHRETALEIIEKALDTLMEVGNGVTDQMLHELCDEIFILRDIVVNKIGCEGDAFIEECAERMKS